MMTIQNVCTMFKVIFQFLEASLLITNKVNNIYVIAFHHVHVNILTVIPHKDIAT